LIGVRILVGPLYIQMIILDVETTGVKAEKDSIVSIGAVEYENPTNQFYIECRIADDIIPHPKALEVNGFTEEQLRDPSKPSLKEAVYQFIHWTNNILDLTLAGENPSFDRDFIRAATDKFGTYNPFGFRTNDLQTLTYAHHKKRGIPILLNNRRTNIDLNFTLTYVGLPTEPNPHNALTGAKMEAEAFSRLMEGKNLLKEFSQYPVPTYLRP